MATSLAGWAGLAATITFTALLGGIIDLAISGKPGGWELILAGAWVIGLRAGLTTIQRLSAFQAAARRKNELRVEIYRKLLQLGPDHVKSEQTGTLVNECVEGVEALDALYGVYLPQLLVGLSAPLLICAYVISLDWTTGLALFVAAPIPPLLLGCAKSRFRTVSQSFHAAMGGLSALFLDSVHGLVTLKLFDRGRARAAEIRERSEELRREAMRLLATNQLVIFFMDWGFAISATAVAAVVGTLRWQAGALTPGEAVVAILLSAEMIRQINLVAAFFFAGAGGRVVLKKIDRLLELPVSVAELSNASVQGQWTPSIEFRSVSFRYAEAPVLDDVSFRVEPGEVVEIIGPSGGGKTTILHLLLRFADPESGEVLVSDQPLREYPLSWLRRRIALVAQDPHLFHGTLAENLRVARPEATQREIETAARSANLHDFILSLPEGYETPLGERGMRLSGGQAQRVAIARAFLQDAPILLLDEATANLDAVNEAAVGDALRQLRTGRTTLIVAHRRGALRHADRVLLLRDGRIAAGGETHTHLLVT